MNSRPFVVGILLGRAGAVNQTLADLRRRLDEQRAAAGGLLIGPLITGTALDVNWQGVAGVLNIAKEISHFMVDHFRTGFLRFAAASELRKLLA